MLAVVNFATIAKARINAISGNLLGSTATLTLISTGKLLLPSGKPITSPNESYLFHQHKIKHELC